ncbi:MAG: thioredoxin family protein [Bacilli bacterium]|nr:thioredoxin family protein [Bacilli bacterium]
MKKAIQFLLILFSVFIISGCKNSGVGYTEVSYDELINMLNNKESFMLMIGSSNCTHCDEYKLTLEEINKKYGIDVKYIDISKITDENEINNLKSYFYYAGTPTTINVVDGVEENTLSRIVGSRDYSFVKDKMIQWGYIKE